MKRFLVFTLLVSLITVPSSVAAPKKITVKSLELLTTVGLPEEVSGAVVSGSSIIVYGTKVSKAYARAIDSNGDELWDLSLDQSDASIATAATVDSAGNIWITGATPLAANLNPPAPVTTQLNPDNAVIPPSVFVDDLKAVAIWKVSPTGELIFTHTLPTKNVLFPTAIAVDKKGASVVGLVANEKGMAGFLSNTEADGKFSKLVQIGSASTTVDSVVRHSDGSITIVGSSSETLAGKKPVGITDGVLVKVSKSLKITNVVRSSIKKGKRIWNSASTSLLLAGEEIAAGKAQTAVTKFSSTYRPQWTYRFASTGPALSTTSSYAFFISTGPIAQLNWNPKAPTPLLLSFNSKGGISAAYRGPKGQKEVLGLLNSKKYGVFLMTSGADTVSIFTLLPR